MGNKKRFCWCRRGDASFKIAREFQFVKPNDLVVSGVGGRVCIRLAYERLLQVIAGDDDDDDDYYDDRNSYKQSPFPATAVATR